MMNNSLQEEELKVVDAPHWTILVIERKHAKGFSLYSTIDD